MKRAVMTGCICSALLAAAGAVHAQAWQWKDEQGRMQFSDQPPPSNIRPENIVKTPSGAPARPASTAGSKSRITYEDPTAKKPEVAAPAKPAAEAKTAGANADAKPAAKDDKPMSMAEKEADYQKRKKEQAEAQEKTAKEEAAAQQKRQACDNARANIAAIESGQRIARPNAKGEREFLDDSGRAAELSRSRENASKACS
jgi:type IV secretory pathway VirB10-like protein